MGTPAAKDRRQLSVMVKPESILMSELVEGNISLKIYNIQAHPIDYRIRCNVDDPSPYRVSVPRGTIAAHSYVSVEVAASLEDLQNYRDPNEKPHKFQIQTTYSLKSSSSTVELVGKKIVPIDRDIPIPKVKSLLHRFSSNSTRRTSSPGVVRTSTSKTRSFKTVGICTCVVAVLAMLEVWPAFRIWLAFLLGLYSMFTLQ